MDVSREVKGEFRSKGETDNYQRLIVYSDENEVKGSLYIPKDKAIPDRLILEREQG
ncbi:MAG TPA: hypothetical protein VMW89_06080 [Desulfatiglandales bacterium]|nr:hypothetical protein [Desulfatiglandales bacterium]